MKKALVVGGNSGIGLSIVHVLLRKGYDYVYIVGKDNPQKEDILAGFESDFLEKTRFQKIDLTCEDFSVFDSITDIDTLVYTAGFGRVAPFESLSEIEIAKLVKCNMLAGIQLIKKYYAKLQSETPFYCAVMGSISGHVASPLFSVYGASKFGLCSFIENVNAELLSAGYNNRILDVSPGAVKGTNFNQQGNDIEQIMSLAENIVGKMLEQQNLYIPQYEETYQAVIERYRKDPIAFGKESYRYKLDGGRIQYQSPIIVGYLSGTFDLFHIGHLNLLKRAKQECDYLVVGVHKSGAWKGKETFIPFEERKAIVESLAFVDKVIESFEEDSDAYDVLGIKKLFVGSDYKGSARFAKYEEYFKDKNVEIVYFPYTKGTSSTQLRDALHKKIEDGTSS